MRHLRNDELLFQKRIDKIYYGLAGTTIAGRVFFELLAIIIFTIIIIRNIIIANILKEKPACS